MQHSRETRDNNYIISTVERTRTMMQFVDKLVFGETISNYDTSYLSTIAGKSIQSNATPDGNNHENIETTQCLFTEGT